MIHTYRPKALLYIYIYLYFPSRSFLTKECAYIACLNLHWHCLSAGSKRSNLLVHGVSLSNICKHLYNQSLYSWKSCVGFECCPLLSAPSSIQCSMACRIHTGLYIYFIVYHTMLLYIDVTVYWLIDFMLYWLDQWAWTLECMQISQNRFGLTLYLSAILNPMADCSLRKQMGHRTSVRRSDSTKWLEPCMTQFSHWQCSIPNICPISWVRV